MGHGAWGMGQICICSKTLWISDKGSGVGGAIASRGWSRTPLEDLLALKPRSPHSQDDLGRILHRTSGEDERLKIH